MGRGSQLQGGGGYPRSATGNPSSTRSLLWESMEIFWTAQCNIFHYGNNGFPIRNRYQKFKRIASLVQNRYHIKIHDCNNWGLSLQGQRCWHILNWRTYKQAPGVLTCQGSGDINFVKLLHYVVFAWKLGGGGGAQVLPPQATWLRCPWCLILYRSDMKQFEGCRKTVIFFFKKYVPVPLFLCHLSWLSCQHK